jgi:hypothetical protein
MKNLKSSVAWVLFAGLVMAGAVAVRPALAAEDTELAKQMEHIQDAQKKLRKSLKSPAENAASLDALTTMQQAVLMTLGVVE